MNRARFKLFLDDVDAAEIEHISEVIQTVCISVYGELESFDIVTLSQAEHDAKGNGIPIVPTLLRITPHPERRFFGDLTDSSKLHNLLLEDQNRALENSPVL